MSDEMDHIKLGTLLQQITALCAEATADQAAHYGIPEAQSRALAAFEDDKAVRIGILAERMGLAPSRLTRLVDGLAEAGFAERIPDKVDRRATLIGLTKSGRKAKKDLVCVCQQRYQLIAEEMNESRRSTLLNLLSELLDTMREIPVELSGKSK